MTRLMCSASRTADSWAWAFCAGLMGMGIMGINGKDMRIMRINGHGSYAADG